MESKVPWEARGTRFDGFALAALGREHLEGESQNSSQDQVNPIAGRAGMKVGFGVNGHALMVLKQPGRAGKTRPGNHAVRASGRVAISVLRWKP